MILPKVVVTGFPDSGTSFLCNLVSSLGYHPGSFDKLKGLDAFHPLGCWEYLDIMKLTWGKLDPMWQEAGDRGFPHIMFIPGTQLPDEPLDVSRDTEICDIAEQDNVEVLKDCSAPWTYKLFPRRTKYVIISRDFSERVDVPECLQYLGYGDYTMEDVHSAWDKYHRVVYGYIMEERRCYHVRYEDFFEQFEATVRKLCGFLGVDREGIAWDDVRRTWEPRIGQGSVG